MRILLTIPRSFNPKQMYREYPLGVGYLGTVLKTRGHDIRVFDENVEGRHERGLLNRVEEFQPDIVGFSVITPNYPVARQQIRQLRNEHPSMRIIAGGVHASLFPEDLVEDGVDVVVRGEAEAMIHDLVSCLGEGREPAHLAGVAFRDARGKVVRTPGWPPTVPLDSLTIVHRSLYNLSLYSHHSMLASRGCPHHCAFCCNYTGTVRDEAIAVRGHQRVVEEMEHLRDAYGAREIFFADDIFLLRKRDILQFCRLCAERRVGVSWIGQMRADRIDPGVAVAMAEAGCQRIYLGVESGSESILRRAKKGLTKDQIRQGIQAAQAAGLRVKTGWIYGLPGSIEEQYESIEFMLELRPEEISIHQLIPFPGTIYYSHPEQFGIRIQDPKAFESFCYGGVEGNVRFDYLSQAQLVGLLEKTGAALEAAGYVCSDQATPGSKFIYTTPLNRKSMTVFRPAASSPQAAASTVV
jgi:anaerobic magnesium-protoporphyrin IX monomethyl ester cyclase